MKLGNSSTPPEERLDAAIDLVVREMVDGEPRADFRGRVVERPDHRDAAVGQGLRREVVAVERCAALRGGVCEGRDRRDASVGRVLRPGVKWTWLMGPVAAAAVVLLAFVLLRPVAMPEPRPTTDIALRAPASLK